MTGELRRGEYEPITPMQDGKPPDWVVVCLDCGFSVDEHGVTGEDAVKAVAPRHEHAHKLTARPVNYSAGWGEKKKEPHPLYGGSPHAQQEREARPSRKARKG